MALQPSNTGWSEPTLEEVREVVVRYWLQQFGDDSPTQSPSANGQIIDTLSLVGLLILKASHAAYLDGFVRSAQGSNLDRLWEALGILRRDNSYASFDALFVAEDGASFPISLPLSTIIQNAGNGRTALTDAATSIPGDTTEPWVQIDVGGPSPPDGNWRVTIDGTPYTFVASSNTPTEIVEGLRDEINMGADAVAIATSALLVRVATPGVSVVVTGPGGGVITLRYTAVVRCTENSYTAGTFGGLAGLTLGAAIVGVDLVGNFSALFDFLTLTPSDYGIGDDTPGQVRETDAEYLARALGIVSASATNAPRLHRAIASIAGVEDVIVYENETDATDGDGRPPHSVEAVVTGGGDGEIRQAIFDNVAAGIQAYGTETPSMIDGKEINYSRPTPLYLWIDLDITAGEGYAGGSDAATVLRQAIVAYLTDLDSAGYLRAGRDVYRLTIASVVAQTIQGISSCVVELDATATEGGPPTLAAADVVIGVRERALVAASRITVSIS